MDKISLTKMKVQINSSSSVISQIHTLLQDFVRKRMQEEGLPDLASSHGNILFQLSTIPDKEFLTMTELAQRINRDKSTTTVLVRKLEQNGFLKISSSKDDKRTRTVALTEKGRHFTKQTDLISKDLLSTFYQGFTEEEKKQFCVFLERIQNNFSEK